MKFYGRQEILELLNKRVNGLGEGYRQNIAIIGEEHIGKTHLIQYWLSKYCNNYIVPIYIEVKPQELDNFSQKFIGIFLYTFLQNSQISLHDDIGYLLRKAQNYIPRTAKLCRDLLGEHKKKRPQDDFVKIFHLPEVFYEETGKRCCVILDEFHRIEEMGIKDLYADLRKCIMLNKNTMYLLVSSRRQTAERILASNLNLLFGNFQKVDLESFNAKTALLFIQDKLKHLDVSEEILNFIIDFSASRPFYLNVICNALADYHTKNTGVHPTIDSLVVSLESVFLEEWGILNKLFSGLLKELETNTKNPTVTKILIELANGTKRLPEIARRLHKTKKEVSLLLNQLQAFDLISKTVDIYMLCDRVFGFWLKYIFAAYLNAFAVESHKQGQLFRKELRLLFDNFNEEQAKAMSERILELFNQFSNESVQLQKKHLRLNHFKEVKLFNINGEKIREGILCRAPNSLWIAGIKEDYVGEDDIIEFIDACKKFKYNKPLKRILITLDEMDVNARLIAKEEKIITWDLPCINSLLEIYGRPRIVKRSLPKGQAPFDPEAPSTLKEAPRDII